MAVGIECKGESYGLLIDTVGEVLKLDDNAREPNPVNLDLRLSQISAGVHRLDGQLLVAGELQSFGFQALAYQTGQPRFENAHVALLQQCDFLFVDVHADNVIAAFGKTGPGYETYIPCTDNRYSHSSPS